MSLRDRRLGFRVPLQLFLTQYVRDRPSRVLATNLSDTGISLHGVKLRKFQRKGPERRAIALEIQLPGVSETIWARGEVCHAEADPMVETTGVRFTGIATHHARMIRDFCIESRRAELGSLLERIRNPAGIGELPAPA